MIYIDDEYVGESGEQGVFKSYRAGEKHSWRIECDLYHNESGEATIPAKEGENITIDQQLRPAFGYLNVTSNPESGAAVFIDGKKVGQTPFKSDRLASGEHKVRVMKEMFSAAENTFTVTDGNTIQASLTMTANFVSVEITTDSESDIYVDNEKKGKGSWTGRLSEGPHSLEAKKASHKTTIKNVQLDLGQNETIVIPNPEPIYGTLDVVSNPIGANIIIDGNNFGTTPRVLNNVLVGNHKLRLDKSGYVIFEKDITLDDTNRLSINETLMAGKEIAISTDGTGDKIFVDGIFVGNSPLTATFSFGEHEVKAIRDNKESKKSIKISSDDEFIYITLKFYPDGAIKGVFSVNENKKVYFSQGNIQYQASTRLLRFAENQWDMIGYGNKNHIPSGYSGWIDLFGWGTGNNLTKSSYENSDYNSFSDWGKNTISNGKGSSWFTLTKDEWVYVFDERNTSSGIRYANASVNEVNGVILLPDNWDSSNYSLNNTNNDRSSYRSNLISQCDWMSRLEVNGAVFLPAAGCRDGMGIELVGSHGYYWSATYCNSDGAYSVSFGNPRMYTAEKHFRCFGQSVRLVTLAE